MLFEQADSAPAAKRSARAGGFAVIAIDANPELRLTIAQLLRDYNPKPLDWKPFLTVF